MVSSRTAWNDDRPGSGSARLQRPLAPHGAMLDRVRPEIGGIGKDRPLSPIAPHASRDVTAESVTRVTKGPSGNNRIRLVLEPCAGFSLGWPDPILAE